MTKIIAEIGWNHMGDLDLAKKMIVAASENGSDFVKTQFFSTKNLKPGPWDNDGRRDIYEKAQLTIEKYLELKEFCSKKKETDAFTIEVYEQQTKNLDTIESMNDDVMVEMKDALNKTKK